jgi:hypothetical protein
VERADRGFVKLRVEIEERERWNDFRLTLPLRVFFPASSSGAKSSLMASAGRGGTLSFLCEATLASGALIRSRA